MLLLMTITALAALAGAVLPPRWGVLGFLATAFVLFALQVTINSVTGFAGTSIAESLLFFNGSWVSYLGFNLQITYRAFALPLLVLSAVVIFRMGRS